MKKRYLIFVLCAFFTLFGLTSCNTTKKDDDKTNQVEEYTVTFNSKGGSAVSSQTVKAGEKAKAPTAPTREGYDFKGWYTDEACTSEWKFDVNTVTANTTLYAKWEEEQTTPPAPVTYSITYVSDHGTKPADVAEATALPDPLPSMSDTGWNFLGWYTTDTFEESSKAVAGATLTANATLYAKWEETFTVTFNSNSGSAVDAAEVVKGNTVTVPTAPTRDGYVFDGWYKTNPETDSNAVAWNFETDTVTEDITLYAKWEETFTVTFNSNGGSTVDAVEVVKGSTITAPIAPTRDGCEFDAWYKTNPVTDSSAVVWNFETDTVTEDITLYANWFEIVNAEVYWLGQTYDAATGSKYNNVEVFPGATLDTSAKSITVNSGEKLNLPRLKLNGATSGVNIPATLAKGAVVTGTPTQKGIKIESAGAGTIHFYVAAAGSGERSLVLINAEGTIIDFVTTKSSSMVEYTWELPAKGDYYFVDTNGYNFYYIETEVKAPLSPAVGISVSNEGKVDYLEGMEKDLSNLQLTTNYENGSKRALALEDVNITTDYDKTTPGEYTVNIQSKEFPDFTTSYTLTVYQFDRIELGFNKTTLGGKTAAGNTPYINNTVQRVYKTGSNFNTNNLTVTAFGTSGVTEKGFILAANSSFITYDVNHTFDSATVGNYEITVGVTLNGKSKTDSYDVSVVDAAACVVNDTIQLHVDGTYAGVIGAAGENFNNFKTIQQALDFLGTLSAADLANKKILLTLAAGMYKEKIELTYPNMTIQGSGKETTTIEWDSLYGIPDESGFIQTTDSTATVNVRDTAKNVLIQDVTISNYWNSKEVFDNDLGLGYGEHRALALLVQADQFIMKNSKLLGYQDTLELFTGRQLFLNTYISGTTDFIFGTNNTTYFKGCEIHSIDTGKTDGGYITAFKGCNKGTGTEDYVNYGAIFDDCIFSAAAKVVESGNTAIARPWGAYAAVMIMNSRLEGHISKAEFTGSESKNCRYVSMSGNKPTLSTTKFFEYNNTGYNGTDGSISASQENVVTVLTDATEAAKYADFNVIFATTNGALTGFYSEVWNPTLE